MFTNVLFILTEKAARLHGQLIHRTVKDLMPNAEIKIVWDFQQIEATSQVDVIVAPQVQWLPDVVAKYPRLRWLHLLTAGAELIFEAGLETGSFVISTSVGVNASAIAEYVIGAMLCFTKQFLLFQQQQRQHLWKRTWIEELWGKKAAIIGLGHVGKAVARHIATFGMHISGVSRRGNPIPEINDVFTPDKMLNATAGVRFLVVSVPLTPSTRGLVDREILFNLEPGAFIIDVSRGGVVLESALIEALANKHLGGAALDVFETEPLHRHSKLWNFTNVLITPHVAGTSDLFMERALVIFEQNLKSLVTSGVLVTPVDRQAGY